MNKIAETVAVEDVEVEKGCLFVVVDTYAFSTTVTTALENDTLNSVHTAKDIEELEEYDFPVGGEERLDSRVMNSPVAFTDAEFESDTVGLTSDNGAKRVHQLLEKGAETVALGCLRNAEEIGLKLREDERDVYVVPADRHGEPVIEDYFASMLISNIARGYNYNEDEIETVKSKAENCMNPEHRSDRLEFCLKVNETDTVPITTNGVFRIWN